MVTEFGSSFPACEATLLLRGSGNNQTAAETGANAEEDLEKGRILACRVCGHRICSTLQRITIEGKHEHIQANPAGIVYHLGCFSSAEGCVPVGEESSYWSWFPGYRWQVMVCGLCASHLGWAFRSSNGGFVGLLVGELIEADDEP